MPTFFLSFPELLLVVPFLGSFVALTCGQKIVKHLAQLISIILIIISGISLVYSKYGLQHTMNAVSYHWLDYIGSHLILRLDGIGALLCVLVSVSIFASIILTEKTIKNQNAYYCLIFLLQTGLFGVFMSYDALAFYVFWEVVLIPVYFLCSIWGGENALRPTLKFFIYTFLGSMFMFIGIIYLYVKSGHQSFGWEDLKTVFLSKKEQYILFALFMVGFSIKMPIFPFHTWQPKLYLSVPLPITIVLSSVLVKMGIVGVLRWVVPFFLVAINDIGIYLIVSAVIGIIYASLIAIKQDDLKLIASYSSIAHIGLMGASILTLNECSIEGASIQMFNHGINVIGIWMLVYIIEKKYNTTNIKQLGGIISNSSFIGFLFIVISFANMALPLTNSFIGEFPMLLGLYKRHYMLGVFGGLTVILSAVYMLRSVDLAVFGNQEKLMVSNLKTNYLMNTTLVIVVLLIFLVGIYPKPIFDIIHNSIILIK